MQKVFYLSEKEDRDIIEFLEGVGRNRQSEEIRKALRFYINHIKNNERPLDENRVREIVREELRNFKGGI